MINEVETSGRRKKDLFWQNHGLLKLKNVYRLKKIYGISKRNISVRGMECTILKPLLGLSGHHDLQLNFRCGTQDLMKSWRFTEQEMKKWHLL